MSSLSADELAQFAKASFSENCCAAAAVALLIYDWAITLGQELRYVWGSKFRGYTALFLLNRINTLGMIVGIMMGLTPWYTGEVFFFSLSGLAPAHSWISCEAAVLVLASFQMMNFSLWAVVSCLRVYAVSNRHIGLACLTFVLAMVPVGTNMYNYIDSSYFVSTYSVIVECQYSAKFSDAVGFKLLIITRVCVIAADALVLLVTWRHLHGTLKSSQVGANRVSLGLLLLRDGTLYFVLLLLLNIAQIIAVLRFGQNFDPIPDFIFPVTSIIISRFILNLRRFSQNTGDPLQSGSWVSEEARSPQSGPRSYLSSIMFRSGIGRTGDAERTVGSIQDGIVVKVSTYSDADDFLAGRGEGDGEAMELERVPYLGHRPYSNQSFDPLEIGRMRAEKGEAC